MGNEKGDNYTSRGSCFWYILQMIIKGTGGLGHKKMRGDHANNYITEKGQNTEQRSVDLRRIAVSETPVKDRQLNLMRKTLHLTSARRPDLIIIKKKKKKRKKK